MKPNCYRNSKKATVVSCVYPPEPVVSAQTSAQIAEELNSLGFDVTVITAFPNRPAGKLFSGFSRKLSKRDKTDVNIEIVRCFATLSPTSRLSSRLLENLSFGLTSGWQVLTMPRPDVIYANTWPIIATGLLSFIAYLRRIPLVISIQDVYPEAMFAQQRISQDSFISRLMYQIDGIIARNSAHIIVISERFADIYRQHRQVNPARLSLIPNWIENNKSGNPQLGKEYRIQQGLKDTEFLLVYGGNIGVAAGVEQLIESMHLLSKEPDIRLLVAGSGSQLLPCQRLAQQCGDRVRFHSPWNTSDHPEKVLLAADLLVLPTRGEQSLASVPSKLLSYMLSGRPILAAALPDSDLANLIIQSGCGWVVAPDRPDLLAEKVREIKQLEPDNLNRLGQLGRNFVLQNLSKDICLPKVINILRDIANGP